MADTTYSVAVNGHKVLDTKSMIDAYDKFIEEFRRSMRFKFIELIRVIPSEKKDFVKSRQVLLSVKGTSKK